MLQQFKEHLTRNFPLLTDKKVLLAVSGGLDSMVLLHLFEQSNIEFSVAHCNFQLRDKESDGDENFVIDYCNSKGVAIFVQRFNTKQFAKDQKLSTQIAARELRYAWLSELLTVHQMDYLVTAHHLDDEVETFLINFIRGTGLEGLQGIPKQNEKVIRPLLPFSRFQILEYATKNSVIWREDSSNATDAYVRNQLRHQIIPVFKEVNPSFLQSFQNTIDYLKDTQTLVDDAVRIVYKKTVQDFEDKKVILLPELLQLPNYKAYLYQWLKPLGFTAWEDIYELVNASSGKQIFSESYRLIKDRTTLLITPNCERNTSYYWIQETASQIQVPILLSFINVNTISQINQNIIYIDNNTLKFPLLLRKWQEGDYFYPLGMGGKKKVSKYFKDEKFTLIDKENTWLLCSDNQIVWIVGKRQDERFKVHPTTTNILKIELQ
jgi:tRNA(Ile)-lysidine synthase